LYWIDDVATSYPFILNEMLTFKERYLVKYPRNSRESQSHVALKFRSTKLEPNNAISTTDLVHFQSKKTLLSFLLLLFDLTFFFSFL
jgi:hypothetical protein